MGIRGRKFVAQSVYIGMTLLALIAIAGIMIAIGFAFA